MGSKNINGGNPKGAYKRSHHAPAALPKGKRICGCGMAIGAKGCRQEHYAPERDLSTGARVLICCRCWVGAPARVNLYLFEGVFRHRYSRRQYSTKATR